MTDERRKQRLLRSGRIFAERPVNQSLSSGLFLNERITTVM
jgi:hypothetical protein